MSSSFLTQNRVEVSRNDWWEYIVFLRCAGLEKSLRTTDLWWSQANKFLLSSYRMPFDVVNSGEYMVNLGHGFISRGVYNVKTLGWPNLGINTILRKCSERSWKIDESRKNSEGVDHELWFQQSKQREGWMWFGWWKNRGCFLAKLRARKEWVHL